jgi:hypothetical protein
MVQGQSRGPEDGSRGNDEGDSVPRIDQCCERGATMSARRGAEGMVKGCFAPGPTREWQAIKWGKSN